MGSYYLLILGTLALGFLVAWPLFRYLERTRRAVWGPVPGEPVAVARGGFRDASVTTEQAGRAPAAARVAAFVSLGFAVASLWGLVSFGVNVARVSARAPVSYGSSGLFALVHVAAKLYLARCCVGMLGAEPGAGRRARNTAIVLFVLAGLGLAGTLMPIAALVGVSEVLLVTSTVTALELIVPAAFAIHAASLPTYG